MEQNVYFLERTEPPANWMEGLLTGTGRLACILYGSEPLTDILTLNHEALWTLHCAAKESPDAAKYLPGLRALLTEGKADEAMEYLMANFAPLKLKDTKSPDAVDSYQPSGNITFKISSNQNGAYSRKLDFITGTASVTSGGVKRSVRGDLIKDRIAGSLSSDQPFSVDILLTDIAAADQEEYERKLTVTETGLTLAGMVPGGAFYCVQLDLSASGTAIQDGIRFSGITQLDYEVNVGYGLTAEEAAEDVRRISAPGKEPADIAEIDIPGGGAVLQAFNFAKHLLRTGTTTGKMPLNLQGKWNPCLRPPWMADYHLNINLQMNYWPTLPLGYNYANKAMLDFFYDHALEQGRNAAQRLFGCRGFYFPWAFDPGCRAAYSGGIWGIWCCVALWMAQHYYAQYEYTLDKTYLADRIYPYLKECAYFLEDFVTYREDGTVSISPSQSPENKYKGAEKYPISLCDTATIDIEIAIELLSNVIHAAEILDTDEADRQNWQTLLSKLPPLTIGKDGRLQEWGINDVEEVEPGHRHVSHLYGIYPGHSIDRDLTPELYAAAKKSLDFRLEHGGGHTGWSRAWCACFKASFRDGDGALSELEKLVADQYSISMLDLHPYGSEVRDFEYLERTFGGTIDRKGFAFQIDGNFGLAAAVAAMLLRCENDTLEILPALPEKWQKNGSVRNIRAKGGYTLTYSWKDGIVDSLVIRALSAGPCRIVLNGKTQIIPLEEGENTIL